MRRLITILVFTILLVSITPIPVYADTTFGDTTVYASLTRVDANGYYGCVAISPSGSNNLSKLVIYGYGDGANIYAKAVVYKVADLSRVAVGDAVLLPNGYANRAWVDLTFASPVALEPSTSYVLGVVVSNNSAYFYYQSSGSPPANSCYAKNSLTYSSPQNPLSNPALSAAFVSIYGVAVPATSVPGTKYEYYDTGDDTHVSPYTNYYWGQTFTPGTNHTIGKVVLKLFKADGATGTATVNIHTTSGGKPTGASLCSGTLDISTLSTSAAWVDITLGAGAALTAGTVYAITFSYDGPQNNVYWRADYSSPTYAGGSYVLFNGSSWSANTGRDLMFEEWSVEAAVTPTVTTSAASSISYTTATLNGNLTDLGAAASVATSFEYGLTTAYGSTAAASESPMAGTGTFHADISSLEPGTLYHFRAIADGDGDPVYGSDSTFTTLTTSPTVTTQAASSVTMDKDGVTGGTFNGNLTNLGDNARVDVSFIYGTTPACSDGETTPEELTETGTFDNSLEFPDNWIPGQTYYYKAKAVGDTYTTPQYGSAQSIVFTMPTFTTEDADYTSPGTATATLNGNISSLGVATNCYGYFEWGYTTSYGNETTPQTLNATGDFDDSISGFLRNTTIHYRAVVEIDGIVSNGSDETFIITSPELTQVLWYQPNAIISGTTLPDRSISDGAQNGTITWGTLAAGLSTSWNAGELTTITLAATNTQDNNATLNGMLSSLGSYAAADVYFQYGLNTSYGSTTSVQNRTSTGVFYADITNLQPSTTYHFRTVAVGTDIVVYGPDMTFTTTGAGVPGTNPPDILTIVDAKVVSGYMTAGDQLYLVSYKCIYLDGTPNAPASDYFVIQILNNGQVVGQWALPGWGYQPVGLYLGPNSALPYGGTYTIRIMGIEKMWPTPPIPSAVRQLNPSDWLGTNLTQLDNWVITTAQSIGSYYNTELVTYTATGTVLNSAGGALFNQNISGLSNIRPMLFSAYATRPSPTSTPSTGTSYIDTWNASTNLGPYINSLLEDGATTMEMDQIAFNNFVGICLWLIIVVILLFAFRGSFMAALIGAPILVGISFAGLLVPVAIVILAVLNVALLAYALLPRGTG